MPFSSSDMIRLPEMEIRCRIGCDRGETEQLQTLRLQLDVGLDLTVAAREDDLAQTLDYRQLVERIHEIAAAGDHWLLEGLCWKLMRGIFAFSGVRWVDISLTKLRLPLGEDVGLVVIRMRRGREDME